MKVLIINSQIRGGGTEVQTLREKNILEKKNHEVWLLTFSDKNENVISNHINIPFLWNKIKKIYYRNRIEQSHYIQIRNIINEISPDIIHINNLQENSFTVLHACEGYKIVKTIRDPGLVCPLNTCLSKSNNICKGFNFGSCVTCIGKRFNYQIVNFQLKSIRDKYKIIVNKFICPSKYLSDVCTDNGLITECVNNPFDFSIVKKKSPVFNKNFFYYGYISVEKGVRNLLLAFREFHKKYPDSKLYIAGKIGNVKIDEIELYLDSGVKYIGVLNQIEIMDFYNNLYCVIVPSIWLENYPNTVLESMASKTMVIGSNRGGIISMIENDKLLFDPLNIQDIFDKLETVYLMDKEEYLKIVEYNYMKTLNNNSIELFSDKLLKIFKSI